jgi:hypothetical protein
MLEVVTDRSIGNTAGCIRGRCAFAGCCMENAHAHVGGWLSRNWRWLSVLGVLEGTYWYWYIVVQYPVNTDNKR